MHYVHVELKTNIFKNNIWPHRIAVKVCSLFGKPEAVERIMNKHTVELAISGKRQMEDKHSYSKNQDSILKSR